MTSKALLARKRRNDRRGFVWISFAGERVRIPRLKSITVDSPWPHFVDMTIRATSNGIEPHWGQAIYERRYRHEDGSMHKTGGGCLFCERNHRPREVTLFYKPGTITPEQQLIIDAHEKMHLRNSKAILPDGVANIISAIPEIFEITDYPSAYPRPPIKKRMFDIIKLSDLRPKGEPIIEDAADLTPSEMLRLLEDINKDIQ